MLVIKFYVLYQDTLHIRTGTISEVFGDMGRHANVVQMMLNACKNSEEYRHYFIKQVNKELDDDTSIIDFQIL